MKNVSIAIATIAASLASGCTGPKDENGGDGDANESAAVTSASHEAAHYRVIALHSLGGTVSSGNSINDLGWITGTSNLAGDQVTRATLWFLGLKLDLGTLGGANSAIIWPVKNDLGLLSGIAETADLDPLGEDWSCSAFFPTATKHTCRGFVWERGTMRPLPTLGGGNGFAAGTNNHRQTVGWAENTIHDPSCNAPQVLQFRAVVWGPGRDQIRELLPFGDDSTSAATAINDHGQVVGISGACSNAVGGFSAAHAVIWTDGAVRNLGDLGGTAWNTPMALNQRGDVVGFANLGGTVPAGHFNEHAVAWMDGGAIRDLGTLPGDSKSQALGINDRRQIVGLSCGTTCRAFLWADGVMRDLNDLAGGTHDPLTAAGDIDDLGIITGQTAASTAFVAVPSRR